MILSGAPSGYDQNDQAKVRAAVAAADQQNFKKGQDVDLARGEKLILHAPNGNPYAIGVSNAGALTVTAL